MRRAFLLFVFVLACGLLSGWGQSRGNVTATADPEVICLGESSQLHAEAVVSTIVDFETGDFSQADFNNTSAHPWQITTSHPYGGTYCMKSGVIGNSQESYIEATVTIPSEHAKISFWVRVSSEANYDKFHFYIDGVEKGSPLSGQVPYRYLEYTVLGGTHTYKWRYEKDGSQSTNDDCVYVDNITFREYNSANTTTYDFENGWQGFTTIDEDGYGNAWAWNSVAEAAYSGSHSMKATYNNLHAHQDYLVSPQIPSGAGQVSFFARRGSSSYYDSFKVFLSTSGNSSASAFSIELTNGNVEPSTTYTRYVYDFSAYQGAKYIAIVYTAPADQLYLYIDDVTFEQTASGDADVTFQWSDGNSIVGTGPDITVTPAQTTTYTVSAYQDDDLVGTAQQTVAVYQDPELSITTNTGSSEICEGDTIVLYVTVGGSVDVRVGDILCTDSSLVRPTQWPCGKTAKGVVFYVDATGQHGWAVDLDYSVAPGTTNLTMKWSSQNQTISGLQTYSLWMDAISDLDGKSNTQKIRSFGTASNYPAAWSVDFDNGWYLPAIGQLNILYGEYFAVNSSLDIVGGVLMSSGDNNLDLWSSSVNVTNSKAYMVRINKGYINAETKSLSKNVRAVIDF